MSVLSTSLLLPTPTSGLLFAAEVARFDALLQDLSRRAESTQAGGQVPYAVIGLEGTTVEAAGWIANVNQRFGRTEESFIPTAPLLPGAAKMVEFFHRAGFSIIFTTRSEAPGEVILAAAQTMFGPLWKSTADTVCLASESEVRKVDVWRNFREAHREAIPLFFLDDSPQALIGFAEEPDQEASLVYVHRETAPEDFSIEVDTESMRILMQKGAILTTPDIVEAALSQTPLSRLRNRVSLAIVNRLGMRAKRQSPIPPTRSLPTWRDLVPDPEAFVEIDGWVYTLAPAGKERKKNPRVLAVINEDCSGCAGSSKCMDRCSFGAIQYISTVTNLRPDRVYVVPTICTGCMMCATDVEGPREFNPAFTAKEVFSGEAKTNSALAVSNLKRMMGIAALGDPTRDGLPTTVCSQNAIELLLFEDGMRRIADIYPESFVRILAQASYAKPSPKAD